MLEVDCMVPGNGPVVPCGEEDVPDRLQVGSISPVDTGSDRLSMQSGVPLLAPSGTPDLPQQAVKIKQQLRL